MPVNDRRHKLRGRPSLKTEKTEKPPTGGHLIELVAI
jgi:hypothetical protein